MQERFWAKTGSGKFENGQPQYHPVIYHLADTAAMAICIDLHKEEFTFSELHLEVHVIYAKFN
jgi:hypothetical protein